MTLVQNGETRTKEPKDRRLAIAIELVLNGFSASETNTLMKPLSLTPQQDLPHPSGIKAKLSTLERYGFSRKDIRKLTLSIPGFIAMPTGILPERLYGMERMRRLPNGFTHFLSRDDVRKIVLSLPSLLGEKREASLPAIEKPAPFVSREEMAEMVEMGRTAIRSFQDSFFKSKMARMNGEEWQHSQRHHLSEIN